MNHTETSDDNAGMFRATMPNFIDDMTEQILHNQYPLHFACRNGDEEQLKALLESQQHFVYEEDGLRGWTPMHWAAFSGSLKCLMLLSEHGFSCDITNLRLNQSPAHIAATSGTSFCLKWLLLCGAAIGRQLGCLRALGCQPVNLDTISSRSGVTAIHVAAQAGHARCLRWLLQCGIICIQQDFKGDTPLHKAAHSGSLECVILLVAHGASLSLRNHNGHTPSEVAEMNKHQECAVYLQQALHALQTGVVAPCHTNNPLILMNGESIYECQNKPDCSRVALQTGEDQEMEMGEEALDNAVCQEAPDSLLSEGISGTKRSRDDEDRSCFKRQRCFENSTASKYGTYDNNNVLSSYNAILGVSAEPSKGDNCQHVHNHPQVHGLPLFSSAQGSEACPVAETASHFRGLSSLLEHCQSLQIQSRYDTVLLHSVAEDDHT